MACVSPRHQTGRGEEGTPGVLDPITRFKKRDSATCDAMTPLEWLVPEWLVPVSAGGTLGYAGEDAGAGQG